MSGNPKYTVSYHGFQSLLFDFSFQTNGGIYCIIGFPSQEVVLSRCAHSLSTSMSLMHGRLRCIPSSVSPEGGKNFRLENAAWKEEQSGDLDADDPNWTLSEDLSTVSVPDGSAGELREDLVLNPESDRSTFKRVTGLQGEQKLGSVSLDDLI